MAKVVIEPGRIVLEAGQSRRLTARPLDSLGRALEGLNATWLATNGGSITPDGSFTATTTAGEYPSAVRVTVTQADTTVEALATVVVQPGPLARIGLTTPSPELAIGESHKFTATAVDEYANEIEALTFTWTVRPGIGTVDSNGLFTAGTKAGTFAGGIGVGAIQGDQTREATTSVTIKPDPLDHVNLSPENVTLDIGGVQPFSAEPADKHDNVLIYTRVTYTAKSHVGSIDPDGLFRAGSKSGFFEDAVVVEVIQGGVDVRASASVAVTPDPLARLEIIPSDVTLDIGETQSFIAKAFDRFRNEIDDFSQSWTSAVGTIDDGTFQAGTKAGAFTEAIVLKGTFKGVAGTTTAAMTIRPDALADLRIDPPIVELEPQQQVQLQVTGVDAYDNRIPDLSVSWTSLPEAGQIDVTGNFLGGTKAGSYQHAVTAQADHQGVTKQATADVVVFPGPLTVVRVVPSATTMFTGDRISLDLHASDPFGNAVTLITTEWESDAGAVDGGRQSASFRAGNEPGQVAVAAVVTDGRGEARGSIMLQVDQGYCETERVAAAWEAQWWLLNEDRSLGRFLGTSTMGPVIDEDWGFGSVVGDYDNHLLLEATTNIVVRR